MRYNLDPFNSNNDEQIWRALEQAHLKDAIQSLPDGTALGGGGSVGAVCQGGGGLTPRASSLLFHARITHDRAFLGGHGER